MSGTHSSWSVWLVLSLVVNALLIGFIFGGGIRNRVAPHDGTSPAPRAGFEMVRGLDQIASEEDRDEIRKVFRTVFQNTRELRRDQRRARFAFAQAAMADPYQEADVVEALERLRETDLALEIEIHSAIASQLGRFNAEQRRALIQSMSQGRRQGRASSPRDGEERRGPPGGSRYGPPPGEQRGP